ncbi:hypothetical protein NitYY0826_C0544 [Nitratiruptor sp. YY08-26]|uniref:hypothetical protein n=1 Tax=unclassified Nitratiruptor TaxID=2624044 RepID=UPI00191620B1|nr:MULTISPECIES: hypothetical protein [unclassified Nitratiruptor]BCD61683.1 hypothetical protein NitYY0813_C0542 [Nitratiruptor sp. YY08-13]BCD65618.1 hypothetical protein NitYY0826_C0544 [Nitratiruptor sp. YY08-26]
MNRYLYLFAFFILFVLLWGGGTAWMIHKQYGNVQQKRAVVHLLQLPDLAMSTEAHCIRHRSLTNLFEVFGYGPSLLPYFPSTFIYAPPPYLNAKDQIQ